MKTFWRDVAYARRMLQNSLGFTLLATLTLAVGIGANTAIFSYINAIIIKPLPYPKADRLAIFESQDKRRGWTREGLFSTASFLDFATQNTSFEQTVLWRTHNFNLTGDPTPQLVEGGRVSWNFFDTLGAKPVLGRTFAPEDDRSGAGHVVILGQGIWLNRFAGERRIVGRSITIDGESYTVVGVMPEGFQFPLMGVADLWTPLALTPQERADRNNSEFSAFGRLRPGIALEQAAAECAGVFGHLETEFPQTNKDLTLLVSSMSDSIRRKEGAPELALCFSVVALILFIACANVANLLLTRASARAKEFAVRRALGATQSRLVRQLLTEYLLLFLFAGALGASVGVWGMRWIDSEIPDHIRGYMVNYGHADFDFTTLAFTLGITLLCCLSFGVVPAWETSKHEFMGPLKWASTQISSSKRSMRLRRTFVTAEIALAVMVLITTTLLVESFMLSVRSSPGYNPANLLVAQLALPRTKYAEPWRQRNFGEEVLSRLRALPKVSSVGVASSVPFAGFGASVEVQPADRTSPQGGERFGARFEAVSTDYFSAMQIGLLKGRLFNIADGPDTSPSVLINETMARQFWPNQDPIGRQLRFGQQHTAASIVGVVNDVKTSSLRQPPERQMYVPLSQFPSAMFGFVVRTTGDLATTRTAIRDAIWAVDRDQPISSVDPLQTLMATVDTGRRILAKLMLCFGVVAIILGGIGIYGVMSELVRQRTQEIGIRTAMGATRQQVLGMVMAQGLNLTFLGIALGVVSALALTRLLASELYHVRPNDPITFAAVPIGFALIAVLACCVPAHRAMSVDPVVALRYE